MSCFQNSASVEGIIYAVTSHLNKAWEETPFPSVHTTLDATAPLVSYEDSSVPFALTVCNTSWFGQDPFPMLPTRVLYEESDTVPFGRHPTALAPFAPCYLVNGQQDLLPLTGGFWALTTRTTFWMSRWAYFSPSAL